MKKRGVVQHDAGDRESWRRRAIKGQRQRGRSVKRWIDVVEEDMKKRGVVQQDAGDREGWRRRVVKGLANPC